MAARLTVAHVAAELAPWCKAGGLADVVSALPSALTQLEEPPRVVVFAPLCKFAREQQQAGTLRLKNTNLSVDVDRAGIKASAHISVVEDDADVERYFVECPSLYERGGLYADDAGNAYPDDALRYAFFCLVVLEAAPKLLKGPPDLFHCHDWHTALLPVYLRTVFASSYPDTGCVFTIHNLAHQGIAAKTLLPELGLDWSLFVPERLEHWDYVNFIKGGIAFSEAVTTVSPSYAQEIQTADFGCGLDGFLRARAPQLHGILNGIDTGVWSPQADADIVATYSFDNLVGKKRCRAALLSDCGFKTNAERPLLGVVARLAPQKGLDMLAELVPSLVEHGARLVVLSSGDRELEQEFQRLSERFPDAVAYRQGFDEALSHAIHAGVDMFLMPSRFEPCGLNQMYAMSYGAVPIVHGVGGLKDTVSDCSWENAEKATGFVFHEPTVSAFGAALKRALDVFSNERGLWRQLMVNGMRQDFGWRHSAVRYHTLYRELLASAEERA